jgi:hypothetical protein
VAQLPVSINEEPGYTRDISATGMLIVQGRQQEIGSRIAFTVDLYTPMGTIKLSREGQVIRTEQAYDSDGAAGIRKKLSNNSAANSCSRATALQLLCDELFRIARVLESPRML